jgi:hypothetical protein
MRSVKLYYESEFLNMETEKAYYKHIGHVYKNEKTLAANISKSLARYR